jgi:MFS family permease
MDAWRELRRLPRGIWILAATVFVNRMGTMAQPFLLLYLTEYLHLRPSQAGQVAALYGAGALVAGPLSGLVCDRRGPLPPMLGSLFVSGALMAAYPLARSLPALVVLTLLLAVTAEAFRPANMVLVTSLVEPERRKSAFSLVRLSVNLGMSIGPAVGGLLAGLWFPALFLVDGATSLLAGALLAGSSLWRLAGPPVRTQRERLAAAARGALHDPTFLLFLAATLPASIAFFQYLAVLPLFLVRELGQQKYVSGLMYSVNTLLIVLVQVPLTSATQHWPNRRGLIAGALLFGAGFWGLAHAHGLWPVVGSVAVWTVGEMFFLPGMLFWATEVAPEARRGEYIGLHSMVMSLASMAGPWSGGALQEALGGRPLWAVASGLCLLSAAMLTRLPSGRGR